LDNELRAEEREFDVGGRTEQQMERRRREFVGRTGQ
jgi:hypothetical protein